MRKRLLMLFLFAVIPAMSLAGPGPLLADVNTWTHEDSVKVGWDAVTTNDGEGLIDLAAFRVEYEVFYKQLGSEETNIGRTEALFLEIPDLPEGDYLFGVRAVKVRPADGVALSWSSISWSDNATVCKDGETFGWRHFINPADPMNLRQFIEDLISCIQGHLSNLGSS